MVAFLQVGSELAIIQVKLVALELDVFSCEFRGDAANGDDEFSIFLESSGIQDADLLIFEELRDEVKIRLGHVAAEVPGHTSFVWEVQLLEWTLIIEDFNLNLRVELINDLPIERILILIKRVREYDVFESSHGNIWHKLHVAIIVIVTHVAIKAGDIGEELLPIILGGSRSQGC